MGFYCWGCYSRLQQRPSLRPRVDDARPPSFCSCARSSLHDVLCFSSVARLTVSCYALYSCVASCMHMCNMCMYVLFVMWVQCMIGTQRQTPSRTDPAGALRVCARRPRLAGYSGGFWASRGSPLEVRAARPRAAAQQPSECTSQTTALLSCRSRSRGPLRLGRQLARVRCEGGAGPMFCWTPCLLYWVTTDCQIIAFECCGRQG